MIRGQVPAADNIVRIPDVISVATGAITANAGANLNTSALALNATLTDHSQTSQIVNAAGDAAEVQTGVYTSQKGIRAFLGGTDPISDLPVFVDLAQHQVHEGESHGAQYYSTAPATIEFALTVPVYANTIQAPHLMINLTAYGGAMQVSLYEGSTHTGGTSLPGYNRNRNSATTPGMAILQGVTNVTPGTLLPHTFIVAAAEKQGDSNRSNDEVILKSNTEYRVVLEEVAATTRAIMHFEWYEDLGV